MALSITNPLSSIHIDPSFRFYKLSIPQKKIVTCDDRSILNYFQKLNYIHCSLCLSQEHGSDSVYKHLSSETHALNGMRSSNFVGFLIEELAALIICKRENINYLFYLIYKTFPYEIGIGIADTQFVTIINKETISPKTPKTVFTASLGDFDLRPEKINNKFSLKVVIESGGNSSTSLFPQNFLLYELLYSIKSQKYYLRTSNIWQYLNSSDTSPDIIVCSCNKSMSRTKFETHKSSENEKCIINAGIFCHLCMSLTIFSSGQFLTHFHKCDVNAFFEKLKISDTSEECNSKFDENVTSKDVDTKTTKFMNNQEVHIRYKVSDRNTDENVKKGKQVSNKNKNGVNQKEEPNTISTLSQAVLGKSGLHLTQRKMLIDNLDVFIYNLDKREVKKSRLEDLTAPCNISSLVCCLCMKVCTSDYSLALHLQTGEHNKRIMKVLPAGIFFPDIGELVLCKVEELSYLQHIMFNGMHLINNITLADSNSIFITFYNYTLKKDLFKSHPKSILNDDIKSAIGSKSNDKFRLLRLQSGNNAESPNPLSVFPQSFIIFEFFCDTTIPVEENVIVSVEMNKFLASLRGFKISCVPCGRKKLKYNSFTKHVGGSKFNCGKNCVGLLCHKCSSFSIQPCQSCIRHNHREILCDVAQKNKHNGIQESKDTKNSSNVKHVDIELYEEIDIKEYFNIVNPLCISHEINSVKLLSNYLLKALPLKSNINKVSFSCNICTDWQGLHMKEMLKHITSKSHTKNKLGLVDEYGGLCDVCHVFLLDTKPDVLNCHIRLNHPEYVQREDDFHIRQDESHITINLITEFSYYLLESFVGKLANCLQFEESDLLVFCMVCNKTFYYTLENFQTHIVLSTHRPPTNDHFAAYCKFCKILLYGNDIKWITNHFNYHSHLMSAKTNMEIPSVSSSEVQGDKAIFSQVIVFSSSSRHGSQPKLELSEFEYFSNIEAINLFQNLKNRYAKNNGDKNFGFKCLQCDLKGADENACNIHFLSRVHKLDLTAANIYANICDDCGLLLIGMLTSVFLDHFEGGEHFLKEINNALDHNQQVIKALCDDERTSSGYITKECEDIFSNKDKYDKFVETNILEFLRAERGLKSLCNSISNDIRRIIDKTYPNAKVYFFGSRVSGLAKIKSDIDVFIDIGSEDLERLVPLFSTIPGLFNIKQVILGAKVPIIKLEHKNSGLSCDISCQDGFGIYNTHLIKLYINLDERIYKLCATVLEWAKMNGIRGSPKFTSYSLTWMVLFFLMQPEISLVPTVKWLQDRFRGPPVVINGWNCSFLNDINAIKQQFIPKNIRITLYELVYNFFTFYAMLRTETVLLFPYTGEIVPNRLLTRYSKAPIFYRNIFFDNNGDKLIRSSSFKFMDPFILTCNIVQNISRIKLKIFQALCVHTLRTLLWVEQMYN